MEVEGGVREWVTEDDLPIQLVQNYEKYLKKKRDIAQSRREEREKKKLQKAKIGGAAGHERRSERLRVRCLLQGEDLKSRESDMRKVWTWGTTSVWTAILLFLLCIMGQCTQVTATPEEIAPTTNSSSKLMNESTSYYGYEQHSIVSEIYNCSDVSPMKLRPLHQYVNCSMPEEDDNEEMIVFQAKFEKLVRHHTPVKLYQCRMYLLQLTCSEGWRGVTGDVIRRRKETELDMDATSCLKAVKTKDSPAGRIQEVNTGSLTTPVVITYQCRDWSSHTTSTRVYTVESYDGSISEGDENIEQGVTRSTLITMRPALSTRWNSHYLS